MTVAAKICGLNDADAMRTAVAAGADYVGLVFYPPSPRAVSPVTAGMLSRLAPAAVRKVALFVDAADDAIEAVLAEATIDLLQLHGRESPARVRAIRERFGLPVMKAVKVAERGDLDRADAYAEAADMLLFDAKPPKTMADALPGGNGLVFDWSLLAGRDWPLPWMLSGGLDAANVGQAVQISGARTVDVSSGVEAAPGRKDSAAIKAFLDAVKRL